MYVVKRPFRNLGKVLTAGTVITEPAVIKRFRGRLAEGKIIEVTEQTYDSISAYFKSKYGVDLPPLSKAGAVEVKTDEAKAEGTVTKTDKPEAAKQAAVKVVKTAK